jgi:hypothetical protein
VSLLTGPNYSSNSVSLLSVARGVRVRVDELLDFLILDFLILDFLILDFLILDS